MNKLSWLLTSAAIMVVWVIAGAFQPIHNKEASAMTVPGGGYEAVSGGAVSGTTYSEAAAVNGNVGRLPFHTVNGLSLTDDLKTVYEMKGQPSAIIQDEILQSLQTYQFDDCFVTMIDGSIEYIAVPGKLKQIDIDGERISMDAESLRRKLGSPYFIGEDGIVYKSGVNALKIYLDPRNGDVLSVHYFHTASQ